MTSYCDIAPDHPVHAYYHDNEYGFPVTDEAVLFERLALEIFQAGLSWEIVLKKRKGTFDAFDGFQVDKVAAYGEKDTERLLGNPGIIRNRLKVASIIDNANRLVEMRANGGFSGWLDHNHPMNRKEWTKLFKKTFRFTGGEIVNEFLMSVGYLPTPHERGCPVYDRIVALNPPWNQADPAVFSTD
ncbi:MAG: DNA-3-methyladenine glycosylase I [Rhodospirillales bacterium]|nr:DNA-3-methyladenine glycosylase I [Rhodospirillales bacterium]